MGAHFASVIKLGYDTNMNINSNTITSAANAMNADSHIKVILLALVIH